jgi:O-antigen ligase
LKPFLRILFPIASIGVLFFLQANSPTASLDRLATTWGSIAAGDLGGRVPLWNTTLAIFAEHPILGIGAGDLHASTVLGAVAHNTYLSILAELGLIGFILFVILVGIVFIQALIQARRADILWMALLATWAIGVFTLSWEFRKPTWLLLSLVVVSANLFAPKYRFFAVSNVSSGPEVAKESTGEIKHEDLSSERYAPLPDPG